MAVLASFNTTMHMISRALFGLELLSQPAIIGHYDRSFFLIGSPSGDCMPTWHMSKATQSTPGWLFTSCMIANAQDVAL